MVENGRYQIAGAYCSCEWQVEFAGKPAGAPGLVSHAGFASLAAEAHLGGHETQADATGPRPQSGPVAS